MPLTRTSRTAQDLVTLLAVASGREPADLYLDGATLLNVYSGELYPANVAVKGRRIAYVGRGRSMVGPATQVLVLHNKILAPGYVEPHTHITGMVTPEEFAREVVRSGTTTLVADTLQFLLQTPEDRLPELLTQLSDLPVLVLWFLRLHGASHLPDESMFAAERIRGLLELDTVRAVGEVTRWPAVYYGDEDLMQKIAMALASGRRVEGHAPGTSYERLVALAAAGWSSDVAIQDGRVQPPPGVVRVVLVDPGGRWIVRELVGNFVSRLGGLASSFNVVAHLMVLGQDSRDMARAARRLLEIGGGIVIVEGGETVLEIPLPIGGVMAARALREIAGDARRLYAFLRARGYPHADPHYTLLFLPLDSLPDVRLTYRGVWDVRRGKALAPREDLPC